MKKGGGLEQFTVKHKTPTQHAQIDTYTCVHIYIFSSIEKIVVIVKWRSQPKIGNYQNEIRQFEQMK